MRFVTQRERFLLLVGEINLILIAEAGFIFLSNILKKGCLDFFFFFGERVTVTEHPMQN